MRTLLSSLMVFTITAAYPQAPPYSAVSPYINTAACNEHFSDAFSFCANTAALAGITRFTAAVSTERRFMLAELNRFVAVLNCPVNKGGLGLITGWSGFSDFNETQIGLAYGKQLGKVNIGLQFNYYGRHIAGYGGNMAIAADIGSTWHINKKLYTAIQLRHIAAGKYNKNAGEKLPAEYTSSIGYEVSEKVFTNAQISKEENKPVNVLASVQYVIDKKLFTRFAISTVTASPFFSVGWKWKDCRVDITAGYHQQLGISPGIVVQFIGKSYHRNGGQNAEEN